MTGIKLAFSAISMFVGFSTAVTGSVVATVPSITPETPVALTFGIIGAGIFGTFVAAWKASSIWSANQNEMKAMREEIDSLKRSRAADLRERLERRGGHH